MPGIDFSVACPNDLESLEAIFALKKTGGNRIREIYLAGPQQ